MENPYDEQLRSVYAEMEELRKRREEAVSELVRITADLRYANLKRKKRKEIIERVSWLAYDIDDYDNYKMRDLLVKRHDLETKRNILEYVKVK